jgi:hypothetical protein
MDGSGIGWLVEGRWFEEMTMERWGKRLQWLAAAVLVVAGLVLLVRPVLG